MTTYTFVVLEVSKETYLEIYNLLKESSYEHTFVEGSDWRPVIDMRGIALKMEDSEDD